VTVPPVRETARFRESAPLNPGDSGDSVACPALPGPVWPGRNRRGRSRRNAAVRLQVVKWYSSVPAAMSRFRVVPRVKPEGPHQPQVKRAGRQGFRVRGEGRAGGAAGGGRVPRRRLAHFGSAGGQSAGLACGGARRTAHGGARRTLRGREGGSALRWREGGRERTRRSTPQEPDPGFGRRPALRGGAQTHGCRARRFPPIFGGPFLRSFFGVLFCGPLWRACQRNQSCQQTLPAPSSVRLYYALDFPRFRPVDFGIFE
jgi:hypothetical protein